LHHQFNPLVKISRTNPNQCRHVQSGDLINQCDDADIVLAGTRMVIWWGEASQDFVGGICKKSHPDF